MCGSSMNQIEINVEMLIDTSNLLHLFLYVTFIHKLGYLATPSKILAYAIIPHLQRYWLLQLFIRYPLGPILHGATAENRHCGMVVSDGVGMVVGGERGEVL